MRKEVCSYILALALCASQLPTPALAFAEGPAEEGVTWQSQRSGTEHILKDPGGGKSGDLYALINNPKVKDGDTIVIEKSGIVNEVHNLDPWVINKSVTIRGGTLHLRAAGILLGADVTFEDVSLSFSNAVCNAVMANGHTLTLNNVSVDKNASGDQFAQDVHLFCGGLTGRNVTAKKGPHGKIVISGKTELNNLYAGSMASRTDGVRPNVYQDPATIIIKEGTTGKLGNIYASGAEESYFDPTHIFNQEKVAPPKADAGRFQVTGPVKVELNDSIIRKVDGKTGGAQNAAVTYDGPAEFRSVSLSNVSSLSVRSGELHPSMTNLSSQEKTSLSVAAGALLNLTQTGETPSFGALTGGGTLVLGQRQKVTFADAVTGKTQVAINGVSVDGDSSALPILKHPYLTAPQSGPDAFVLLPHSSRPGDQLGQYAGGVWSVGEPAAGPVEKVVLKDIELGTPNVSSDRGTVTVPVTASFAADSPQEIEMLPYRADVSGTQTAAKLEDGSYVCRVTVNYVPLLLEFGNFESGCALQITPGDSELTIHPGTYQFQIVIPQENLESGATKRLNVEFTVPQDSVPEPPTPPDPAKKPQTITAGPVNAIYGAKDAKVEASTNGDGTLHYAVKDGADVVEVHPDTGALTIKKAGQATVQVTASATSAYNEATTEVQIRIAPKSITTATAAAVPDQTYTGEALQPKPVVTDDTTALVEGRDFTYSYENHTYVGTGKVLMNGIGNYQESLAVDFSITPKQQTVNLTNAQLVQGKTLDLTTLVEGAKGTVHFGTVSGDAAKLEGTTLTADPAKMGKVEIPVTVDAVNEGGSADPEYLSYQGTLTVTVTDASQPQPPAPNPGGGGSGGSSGGGSSHSHHQSNTVKNPDGSSTTTTVDRYGTEVKTTKETDGSTTRVETKKDGTVTTTKTDPKGNRSETVEKDGTTETTVQKKDGTKTYTKTDAYGRTEAKVQLPSKVVNEAAEQDETLVLPMPSVSAGQTTVEIQLQRETDLTVSVPVKYAGAGTVAIRVNPDGSREVIRKSVVTEDGLLVPLDGSSTLEVVNNEKTFQDTWGHWAEDAIAFVTSHELFQGTSDMTFTPDRGMTRGMLAKVLHNLESNPESFAAAGFTDVPGDLWCGDAIRWSVERGIVNGYADGSFRVDQVINREQLATMLYRYAGSPAVSGDTLSFRDAQSVSDFAKDAMTWAVEQGILTGKQGGRLDPKGTATRAQVATMLQRFAENGQS